MKKILINLCIYTIAISLAVFITGFFAVPATSVMNEVKFNFRCLNGFELIMQFLPSIMATGFLLGTSIYFGKIKNPSRVRFSHTIISCFKEVMICAVIITVILTVTHEILIPFNKAQQIEMIQRPKLLESYLSLSEEYLEKAQKVPDQARLSEFYAKKALELDKKNERAKELVRLSEIAGAQILVEEHILKSLENNSNDGIAGSIVEQAAAPDNNELFRIKSSSVLDLVTQAQQLFEQEDFFGAHYYAQSAVKIASGTDINLAKARDLAAKAWNILNKARQEKPTEENYFFRQKFQGYLALNSGNFLKSYYIFQTLSNQKPEYAKDPDVIRYLNISRTRVTQEYFFTNETEDKEVFESAKNVYFSLKHPNGSYDIVYISGITDIKDTGNLVRYLRGLYIFSFSEKGSFLQSVYTPYAKMLAVPSSEVIPSKIEELGIDPQWTLIPYVMLHSLDSNKEEVHVVPTYLDHNKKQFTGPNQIFLAMPHEDFDVVVKCANYSKNMNIMNMMKFKAAADYYGYSNDIIMQSIMSTIFYPFIILIFLVYIAVLGWNYRLKEGTVFKFTWIFIILLFNLLFYPVVSFCVYIVKLFNYLFIGLCGTATAVPLCAVCYIIILFLVCLTFLSRKGD